jgi:hypothetical protein
VITLLSLVVPLVFVAAQGGAIFASAFLVLHLLGANQRINRLPAMILSYVAWIAATIMGYAVLGGEGGLMDGFGLVLMLCFTALISTLVYTAIWNIVPSFNRETENG